MAKRNIPDLRYDFQEFTLEHCSVILEKANSLFLDEDGILPNINTAEMHEVLTEMMSHESLNSLFETEMGKGTIFGLYLFKLVTIHGNELENESE